MYQNEGILAFYKGYSASLVLCLLGVMQMVSYEYIKRGLEKVKFLDQSTKAFISGSAGRFIASTIFYPLVLVRSRLQKKQYRLEDIGKTADQKEGEVLYSGICDCFKKTWKREGFTGFYKGYLTTIIRTVPQQGIFFTGYELTMRLLEKHG